MNENKIVNQLAATIYRNQCEEVAYLEKRLAELKSQPYKRWRAEAGKYYYSVGDGSIDKAVELYDIYDEQRFSGGNYFKTEAEAETHKQRLLATQELRDLAYPWIWHAIESGYSIIYGKLQFHVITNNGYNNGLVNFRTEVQCQHAIDTLGVDKLKLIFGMA